MHAEQLQGERAGWKALKEEVEAVLHDPSTCAELRAVAHQYVRDAQKYIDEITEALISAPKEATTFLERPEGEGARTHDE